MCVSVSVVCVCVLLVAVAFCVGRHSCFDCVAVRNARVFARLALLSGWLVGCVGPLVARQAAARDREGAAERAREAAEARVREVSSDKALLRAQNAQLRADCAMVSQLKEQGECRGPLFLLGLFDLPFGFRLAPRACRYALQLLFSRATPNYSSFYVLVC